MNLSSLLTVPYIRRAREESLERVPAPERFFPPKSGLIQSYKIENEAFSYSQDIHDFIEMKKENTLADDVPVRLITKAIKELWVNSGEVVISQRRRSKGGVREHGYLNLKRKLECSATTSNQCEWNELPKITFAGWQSAANSNRWEGKSLGLMACDSIHQG